MNRVSLVVITDGRQDCIQRTIQRFEEVVPYAFLEKIIVNDSGDIRYHSFLINAFPTFKIVSHEQRRGLAGAVQSAWSSVQQDCEFIFHLEDDFLFDKSIDINNIIKVLKENKYLAQMAMVRASVNPLEEQVGGFVFQNLQDYKQQDGWFEHKRLFTLNPCIYPIETTKIGWPDHGGESEFTSKLHSINKEYQFGFIGNIYDPPLVTHIGRKRSKGWFL